MSITTKREFVEALREELPAGSTLTETEYLLDALSATVKKLVTKGHEKIIIPHLVTLERRKRAPRRGRNPFTGEEMMVAEKVVIAAKVPPAIAKLAEAV